MRKDETLEQSYLNIYIKSHSRSLITIPAFFLGLGKVFPAFSPANLNLIYEQSPQLP